MWLILLPSTAPFHSGNLCTLWWRSGDEWSGRPGSGIPGSIGTAWFCAILPASAQLRFFNTLQKAWAHCGSTRFGSFFACYYQEPLSWWQMQPLPCPARLCHTGTMGEHGYAPSPTHASSLTPLWETPLCYVLWGILSSKLLNYPGPHPYGGKL